MSTKTLRILGLILGILVLIALMPTLKKVIPDATQNAAQSVFGFTSKLPDRVTTFSITRADGTKINLTKDSGIWKVNKKYAADSSSVSAFLKALSEARSSGIVSRNSANKAAYGLDDKTAITLSLTTKSGSPKVYKVGSKGPVYFSFYIAKDNSDDVYLMEKSKARGMLEYSLNEWRDKSLVSVRKADIDHVTIAYPKDALITVTEPQANTWEWVKGTTTKNIDSQTMDTFFKTVSNLKADGFASDANAKKFDAGKKKATVVTLFNKDGKKLAELTLLKSPGKDSQVWWTRVAGKQDTFTLSNQLATQLLVAPR